MCYLRIWIHFNSNININPEPQLITESMHLQSTYYLHLKYLQSEAHFDSSRTSAVKIFCGNSQSVKTVGYFSRRAPPWMFGIVFDRILNVSLPNNLL